MRKGLKEKLKENGLFLCIAICFCIYDLYRLFFITPWYDELYTYINFINKGAVYSATHWPLPNNHIFYSVISALINWCGNYIGLRGIAFLASMGTIVLLYCLMKNIFSKYTAIVIVLSYSLLILTNKLAVQGRGYSLATFFLMLAVYCGYHICFIKAERMEYIFWAVSLWLGLYTVVTSVYWVIALCLSCGVILLVLKKFQQLIKLVVSSLAAAGMTVVSYGIMWLAIGAHQIANDITTGYLGAEQWFLVKEFPGTCLRRGIMFMISDSNVQGIDRYSFLHDFKYFCRDVLGEFFGIKNMWYFYMLLTVISVCFIAMIVCILRKKTKILYPLALSSLGFLGIFITLWIQSAYPFARVFSFAGLFIVMPQGIICSLLENGIRKLVRWKKLYLAGYAMLTGFAVFTGIQLMNPPYTDEYSGCDFYSYDAIRNINWDDVETYLVSDVYANQQIEFHQIIGEKRNLLVDTETPDVIITRKEPLTACWPDIITEDTLEKCHISERQVLYENEWYVVYGK